MGGTESAYDFVSTGDWGYDPAGQCFYYGWTTTYGQILSDGTTHLVGPDIGRQFRIHRFQASYNQVQAAVAQNRGWPDFMLRMLKWFTDATKLADDVHAFGAMQAANGWRPCVIPFG